MIKKIIVLICLICAPNTAKSAEGAAGVYILGCQGPMAGYLPPPGIYLRHDDYFYHGRANAAPLADLFSLNAQGHFFLDFTTLTCVTPYRLLGAQYGVGVVLPFGKVSCRATLFVNPFDLSLSKKQTDSGYSDMIVYPIMMGWHWTYFHVLTSLAVFLPTGHYQIRRLANIGKNHYALDPGVGFTCQDPRFGLEMSTWAGCTFNFENTKTHYTTGTELHLEFFLGKWLNNHLQLGCVGYCYDQITGDKSQKKLLGSFKGQAVALGPLLLFNFNAGKVPISINARYYQEFDVVNRFRGGSFFVTFVLPLLKL